jgi:hypothetical protein
MTGTFSETIIKKYGKINPSDYKRGGLVRTKFPDAWRNITVHGYGPIYHQKGDMFLIEKVSWGKPNWRGEGINYEETLFLLLKHLRSGQIVGYRTAHTFEPI